MEQGGSWSGREKNCIYLNLGDQTFTNISLASGVDYIDDSRALATVDWDDDGRLDLLLKNRTAPRLRFLRNQRPSAGNYLKVDLRGVHCNRDAIGAKVTVELPQRTISKTLYAGDGYLAQSSKRLHFGLGAAKKILKLTVLWPDGSQDSFDRVAINSRYFIEQGTTTATRRASKTKPDFERYRTEVMQKDPDSSSHRIVLADKLPLKELRVPSFDAADRRVKDLEGPTLLTLWATWCNNCKEEFGHFQARASEIQASGLQIVALSVDAEEDRARAEKQIAGFGLQAHAGFGDDVFMQTLEVLMNEVLGTTQKSALPTSLLLDEAGKLTVVYQGQVEVDVLLRDVATLGKMKTTDRHAWPLSGGYATFQRRRDFRGLASGLMEVGQAELASFYKDMADQDSQAPIVQQQ